MPTPRLDSGTRAGLFARWGVLPYFDGFWARFPRLFPMSATKNTSPADGLEFSVILIVQNKMGIHARPAAMMVRVSNKYNDAEVWVEKDDESVNGKSIMGLMMLAAGNGTKLRFRVTGMGAEELSCARWKFCLRGNLKSRERPGLRFSFPCL